MAETRIKKPRGTTDYFGADGECLRKLCDMMVEESFLYGCQKVEPPMFEDRSLFHRSVGESSDIVRKETFDLVSKGDHDYTLRPEYTASINRMVIENKSYASPDTPLRLSYVGKVFRYERPQSGRLREFYQFGAEFMDSSVDLYTSLDCLLLAYDCARKAVGKEIEIRLNYLGSIDSREKYKNALKDYFAPFVSNMCDDCKERIKINPLRILDCKVEEDRKYIDNAPRIENHLTQEDKREYELMLKALDEIGVPYVKDSGLVRGLDYYSGLVFELYDKTNPSFPALGGGGKYGKLMEDIGGPKFEGIGFSLGVERLMLDMSEEKKKEFSEAERIDVLVVDREKQGKAIRLMKSLRDEGYCCTTPSMSKALGGCFKMADRIKARYVVIVFEDGHIEVKDMEKREQSTVAENDLLNVLVKEN